MLKNVPKIISPELLKVLAEMGHGDEIVIADGNFPSASLNQRVIRYDGNSVPDLLSAILDVYPLDNYSESQVFLMEVVKGDPYKPEIWKEYQKILEKSGEEYKIEHVERFAFYERTKKAYAVIATGEEALYANVIIKKGVVK